MAFFARIPLTCYRPRRRARRTRANEGTGMRLIISIASIAAAATSLIGCGPSGAVKLPSSSPAPTVQKTQLIEQELTQALSGQTFAWIRARDQATGRTTFSSNGAMTWKRLDVTSSGAGTWKVDGEMLCQTFDPTPTWKGGSVCRKIFRQGTTLTTSLNDGGLVTYTPASGS